MTNQDLGFASFREIFIGNTKNYGEHIYEFEGNEKEKGTNKTVTNVLLTDRQYRNHLEGEIGLGIIPIDENNKCHFVVADIDVYDMDLSLYINAIERNNFPLVSFKSKSGGLHIYMFFKSLIPASVGINLMKRLMGLLSIDLLIKNRLNKTIEIFPKQSKLQGGQIGSWINLPYFDAKKSKQCVIRNNKLLSLEDGLIYIKDKKVTIQDVKSFVHDLPYSDAPPCLQSIFLLNPMTKNTGRNDYLFSFGVYLKKKDENFFEQNLFQINRTIETPLESEELEKTILSSLRRKDYTYKCTQSPCVDFCNKNICKKREYGIGKAGGYFSELEYGKMFQIKTRPPHYKWEVKSQNDKEFKTLFFRSENELIKQDTFLNLCLREIHFLPVKMKQSEWSKLINQYLIDMQIEEVSESDDFSNRTLFKGHLQDFLNKRAMAQTKDQINNNRVFHNKKLYEYYFRGRDLLKYLYKEGFRAFQPTEIYTLLKEYGAIPKTIRTESRRSIRAWLLPEKQIKENLENDKPFEPDFNVEEEEKEEEGEF